MPDDQDLNTQYPGNASEDETVLARPQQGEGQPAVRAPEQPAPPVANSEMNPSINQQPVPPVLQPVQAPMYPEPTSNPPAASMYGGPGAVPPPPTMPGNSVYPGPASSYSMPGLNSTPGMPPINQPKKGKKWFLPVILILLILIAAGAGVFFFLTKGNTNGAANNSNNTSNGNTSVGTTGSSGSLNTSGTINVNRSVNFEGIQLLVIDAKEAGSQVTLDIKANNNGNTDVNISLSDEFILVLPDNSQAAYDSGTFSGSVAANSTNTGTAIFNLTNAVDVTKCSLRLGSSQEEPEVIALGGPTTPSFNPVVTQVNKSFVYSSLNYTFKTVTSTETATGREADSGKRFLEFSVSVNNTTTDTQAPGFATDYFRLQLANGDKLTPDEALTQLDSSFDSGASKTGIIAFEIPKTTQNVTLIFLNSDGSQSSQTLILNNI